jgi:hypothetical protein
MYAEVCRAEIGEIHATEVFNVIAPRIDLHGERSITVAARISPPVGSAGQNVFHGQRQRRLAEET